MSLTPRPGDNLKVVDVFRLSGICLDRVSGHMWPMIFLDGNTALAWKEATGFEYLPGPPPASGSMGIGPRDDARSSWGMGEYRGSAYVSSLRSTPGMYYYYLGVWRGSEISLVAGFFRAPDGSFSAPHVLVSTKSPVRSVSYFPSPDTPAGRVNLTVEADDGLLMYALSWNHPQLFR